MYLPIAITQAPYPRAMTALVAATLAVLIDLIFRFGDDQALLYLLPVAGCVKFSGTLMLVFLQVVADVPSSSWWVSDMARKGS